MNTTESPPFPRKLISAIRAAERITVLTGAGISAESGVPTFRAAQSGLWARYRPEELATPEAFQRNPQLVWEWYEWRRELVREAKPNAGHTALVEIENQVSELTVVTQNVDGLHQRADSRRVIELHGNLVRNRCFDEGVVIDEWEVEPEGPPRCPRCGAFLRPDVVWFGESLPLVALEAAIAATIDCDILFSVGTSSLVHPAASLPVEALRRGIPVVEVNPQQTPLSSHASYTLQGPAGELLPALVDAVWSAPSR